MAGSRSTSVTRLDGVREHLAHRQAVAAAEDQHAPRRALEAGPAYAASSAGCTSASW